KRNNLCDNTQARMNIDLNKFTEKAREAVMEAQAEARRRSHQQVDNPHLLSALLHQQGGLAPALLQKLDVSPNAVEMALERELGKLATVSGPAAAGQIYITQGFQDAITKAEAAASRLKDDYISVEHLLLGLVEAPGSAEFGKFLRSFGLTKDKVLEALKAV